MIKIHLINGDVIDAYESDTIECFSYNGEISNMNIWDLLTSKKQMIKLIKSSNIIYFYNDSIVSVYDTEPPIINTKYSRADLGL